MENKFIKYMKIPYIEEFIEILENEVELYEKLDGGNCQVRKINNRIVCGSRSNFLEGHIVDRMYKKGIKNWFKDFVSWAHKNKSLYNIPEGTILFGEWLAKHTIEYEKKYMNKFYLIDIYDINEGIYIPYEEAKKKIKEFGVEKINFVPFLGKGKFSLHDIEEIVKNRKSSFYDGPMEGVVIKDYKNQKFAKYLHTPFSEIRQEEKDMVRRYVTPQRLYKLMLEYPVFEKKISKKNEDQLVDELIKNIMLEHNINLKREKRRIEKLLEEYLEKYYKKQTTNFK